MSQCLSGQPPQKDKSKRSERGTEFKVSSWSNSLEGEVTELSKCLRSQEEKKIYLRTVVFSSFLKRYVRNIICYCKRREEEGKKRFYSFVVWGGRVNMSPTR